MPDRPSSTTRPYRALIVHQQPNSSERLLRVLHKLGFETVIADGSLDGVRRFDGGRFNLIVMDPEIEASAPEAAELLYSHVSAPVLYLCADARPIGFHALARGVGFLVPPLDPAYMQAVVRRALRGPGMMA